MLEKRERVHEAEAAAATAVIRNASIPIAGVEHCFAAGIVRCAQAGLIDRAEARAAGKNTGVFEETKISGRVFSRGRLGTLYVDLASFAAGYLTNRPRTNRPTLTGGGAACSNSWGPGVGGGVGKKIAFTGGWAVIGLC